MTEKIYLNDIAGYEEEKAEAKTIIEVLKTTRSTRRSVPIFQKALSSLIILALACKDCIKLHVNAIKSIYQRIKLMMDVIDALG